MEKFIKNMDDIQTKFDDLLWLCKTILISHLHDVDGEMPGTRAYDICELELFVQSLLGKNWYADMIKKRQEMNNFLKDQD